MSIVHCLYFRDSPKSGVPGSCIYLTQEQDSPIIPSGIGFVYSRGMHPVARIINSQDKTLVCNNKQNVLYFVFSMITCFGLHKSPSSGDFLVTQNIKKRVTICCNGSVDSNDKIMVKIAVV
jgi:hypothetical protein